MTKRTQAILGLSGVFVIGALCGALVFGVVMRDRARETAGLRSREGFIHHFERRLQLTETQRDSLKDELERTYSQMAALREETSQRYNTLIDTLAVRIMPTLTVEQRELFRDQEQRFRRFLPNERKGPGPGPRPHPRGGPPPHSGTLPAPAAPVPLSGKGTAAAPRASQSPETPVAAQQMPLSVTLRPADSTLKTCASLKTCTSPQAPQPTGDKPPFMGGELKRVQGRLGLSDEQTASFKKIMADARLAIKQIKAEEAERPIVKRRKVGEAVQQMDQQIMNLLTADQQERWLAMRDEMGEKLKQKRRPKRPDTVAEGG